LPQGCYRRPCDAVSVQRRAFSALRIAIIGEHHDGGIIAFVLGAVMLVRGETPGFRVSWSVIGTVVAMAAGLILVVLGSLRRARKGPVRVGAQAMPGLS
jgi:membrane-bound ClpP family serine protease